MPLIQLIRHGESIANAGGISKTPACIPLSDLGRAQALALVDQFPTPPDLIVVSSYLRTGETAAPLLARYPQVRVETWPVHEFTYLSAAQYADTTEQQRTPAARDYWSRLAPQFCNGPGAESFSDFISRADTLMARLADRPEKHICIFTHSFFINAVQWRSLHPEAVVDAAAMEAYLAFRYQTFIANAQPVRFRPPHAACLAGSL